MSVSHVVTTENFLLAVPGVSRPAIEVPPILPQGPVSLGLQRNFQERKQADTRMYREQRTKTPQG